MIIIIYSQLGYENTNCINSENVNFSATRTVFLLSFWGAGEKMFSLILSLHLPPFFFLILLQKEIKWEREKKGDSLKIFPFCTESFLQPNRYYTGTMNEDYRVIQ